jgi:hypothetical protein
VAIGTILSRISPLPLYLSNGKISLPSQAPTAHTSPSQVAGSNTAAPLYPMPETGNSRKSANLIQLNDTSFRVKLPTAVADVLRVKVYLAPKWILMLMTYIIKELIRLLSVG